MENPKWALLAVISFEAEFGYAIETISVDLEECTLSGAWEFESLINPDVDNILHNHLLILVGISKSVEELSSRSEQIVEIPTFITDASATAKDGVSKFDTYLQTNIKQYNDYLKIRPVDRKNMPKVTKKKLEPIYQHSWDILYNQNNPELTLRQLGKREEIPGTPKSMKRLISTSWLTKYLIDRWREDENERKSRKYLDFETVESEILPKSWLNTLNKIQTIQKQK